MAQSQFKIERGIPLPARRNKYPFAEMQIGDSFSAPLSEERRLSASAAARGFAIGAKFSVRRVDADTVRVWRVA